jgi:hypothetical protein
VTEKKRKKRIEEHNCQETPDAGSYNINRLIFLIILIVFIII